MFSFHLGVSNQLLTRFAWKFGDSMETSSETINVAQNETSVAILAHKEFAGMKSVPVYLIRDLDVDY